MAAEKGYAATTITEVVEAAGVSSATFYELFDDKEACFLEAFDAVIDVLVAHVIGGLRGGRRTSPGRERIAAALRAMVELLSAEADIARLAMVEGPPPATARGESYRAGAGALRPLSRGGARLRRAGRPARRHRALRDRRRHLDDLRRDPRRPGSRPGADPARPRLRRAHALSGTGGRRSRDAARRGRKPTSDQRGPSSGRRDHSKAPWRPSPAAKRAAPRAATSSTSLPRLASWARPSASGIP